MEAVTYSTFRKDLRKYLDSTRDNAEPILVTSQDSESNVVVINAKDYDSLLENLRIYSNPYLLDKIQRGINQVNSAQAKVHDLIEVEDD